jgi:hypothetical protein
MPKDIPVSATVDEWRTLQQLLRNARDIHESRLESYKYWPHGVCPMYLITAKKFIRKIGRITEIKGDNDAR